MVRIAAPFDLDNVVAAQLQRALSRLPLLQLRKLLVSGGGGAVTLRGELHTAFEKEVALACARRIAPDRHVIDATCLAAQPVGDGGTSHSKLAWLDRRIRGVEEDLRPKRIAELRSARVAAVQAVV